ncbi:hypothetical protein DICVIV_07882 [Dictyocaulus viviparus]|uniref:Uncharacterized protein n=1 Tax=Dictyocaulus viviparus TaxID=29172 RepID=A0A0D8XQN8_DICVI|nr:hypothetical protein DICVIV_07882 [Dictyocaulus viviparus]
MYLDLSPHFVMISSTPVVIQLKIHLTLTISIAIERILGLSYPIVFRKLSSYSCAKFCLLFGILLGAFDVILGFKLSSFHRVPNCAANGCFISDQYRYYVMSIIAIVLITVVLKKLQIVHRRRTQCGLSTNIRRRYLRQANRTCIGILFISLVFVTIPSVGVGFGEMFGYSIFRSIGPFYIVGLLCAG